MRRLATLLLIAVVALGACSDDDEDPAIEGADRTSTSAPAGSAAGDLELASNLRGGAAEVPDQGDPDGRGRAVVTLKRGANQVCYKIEVQNIATVEMAHIHEGGADVAGPIVVNFSPPLEGCATAEAGLINRIAATPGRFYVNVHTADYPKGAARGQLEVED